MASEINVITHDITRKFGKFIAVDHINIEVYKGEIFGFLGANGAGKTTLIRMLCGLLKPTSGNGTVAGFDIMTQSEQIKLNIGYMSQKFSLYDDLTVKENLTFFGGIYGLSGKILQSRILEVLDSLDLVNIQDSTISSLPVGFRQRLGLGCSLLHNPPILFLDEPTSGVDPQVRRNFWDIIYRQANEGKTIFVTTHFMDEAEYCNRVLIMKDGHAIAMDNPRILKKNMDKATMQEVFISLVQDKEGIQ
ncbi:MAG TPA: ABC transporter ATP-binding protein [Candidatus Cloacimonadota bacterium]|nr:ABC transporter ATP-binding protein [Candidatus Cloacimonadota bacterium]